jgi:tripartite ATP-independent transporter DctP family solute receptor
LALCSGCGKQEEVKILRVAYSSAPTELLHAAAERFARRVGEMSGGTLQVRLYPSGQLGNERVLVEGLRLRSVDMVITGCAIIGWYAPQFSVVEAPFVWRDHKHVERVWSGPIGHELRQTLRDVAGIELDSLWYRGPRYLTTTAKRIQTPADLRGLKLRMPELEVYMKSWRAFGANTTPLPFNDMFMALKLGVVEGQENPLATIYGNNLHEVQKYIMETRHLIGFYIVAKGPHFKTRFDPQQRAVLKKALREATVWHNEELQRSEHRYRQLLEEAGIEFVHADRDAFRRIAQEKIPPLFERKWKPGLYREICEAR